MALPATGCFFHVPHEIEPQLLGVHLIQAWLAGGGHFASYPLVMSKPWDP